MEKISKTGFIILTGLALTVNASYAQIEEVGNMVAGGAADAKVLLQPYIAPAVNAFGAAMSGGWYNTAEPHKLGGFDITFTGNVAFIPQSDKKFVIDNSKLNNLQVAGGENNEAPTIGGDNVAGPQIVYNIEQNGSVVYSQPAFRMPQGLNASWVPAPMVQVGIGLIKGTDVMFRYLPNMSMKENEIGLWGIGGRHDIKQWIPGLKRVPIFKMSVFYGYTKLHTFIDMNITKSTIGAENLEGPENWEDQYMKMWVKSQTADLLLAADLKVITFYGSVGFVTTKTDLKLVGDFPVINIPQGEVTPQVVAVTDPLGTMQITNNDGSFTKPRFNVGMRFKLAIITIHFDYSWANYSLLTGGLGISFR